MDKRKENGGHSTKAKGIDKRKNDLKQVVKDVVTSDELTKVLKMLLNKAVNEYDTTAAKMILEYSIGKPTESKDFTTNGKDIVSSVVISDELAKNLSDNLEDEC